MNLLTENGAATRFVLAACAVVVSAAFALPAAAATLALTLDEAVALAVENNDELAIARASADGARARLTQARSGYFPKISASASYTKLDEVPYMDASQFGDMFAPLMEPFDYLVDQGYLDPATLEGLSGTGGSDKIYMGDDDIYSIGVSVQQPIFTGGALLSAHAAARHASEAGRLNAERAEDKTRHDATEAYMALVAARAGLDVMEEMQATMRSHLSDVEAMHEAGMVLDSELMLARVRMSQIELDRNRAEHLTKLASAALSFVIGEDVGTVIEPVDDLEGGPTTGGDLTTLTGRALERRPDLAAMDEMVGAADNGITLARSGYFPSVVLIGNYNWDRPDREYQPDFYEHWSATIALQMNIFDWGGTAGRVNEARAGFAQASRARDMFEEAVKLEVKQSYLARDESLQALVIAEDGLAQAEEAMRVAREAFRNGFATSSDVLDAQAALAGAEMNRVQAAAGLRLAEERLVLATGGTN
jgi:outer membrane protein TolC